MCGKTINSCCRRRFNPQGKFLGGATETDVASLRELMVQLYSLDTWPDKMEDLRDKLHASYPYQKDRHLREKEAYMIKTKEIFGNLNGEFSGDRELYVCIHCDKRLEDSATKAVGYREWFKAWFPTYVERVSAMHAENFEKEGKYEEAAKMWDGARNSIRAREARSKIEKNQKVVTVDVNKLVDQMLSAGIGVQIKCSSCGGPIQNDEKFAISHICPYCGVRIENEYLKNILVNLLK